MSRIPQVALGFQEVGSRQQALGKRLRQMFEGVVQEPVPEGLLEILRRADANSPEKAG